MFESAHAGVAVRDDIVTVFRSFWDSLSKPGATLTGTQRVALAYASRGGGASEHLPGEVTSFASQLMASPETVRGADVRSVADTVGDPQTVETIAIVSMLSAVDGFHQAIGVEPASLPEPVDGAPTGEIAEGLKRRRTHVPVPPGPIPFTLDLVPGDAEVFIALQGPLYMTDAEMASDLFHRTPGLNRAQMELISSRLSFHNECFY